MTHQLPDQHGRFGPFGGRFVPETLMNALIELEEAYSRFSEDEEFNKELNYLLSEYLDGRPHSIMQSSCPAIWADPKSI